MIITETQKRMIAKAVKYGKTNAQISQELGIEKRIIDDRMSVLNLRSYDFKEPEEIERKRLQSAMEKFQKKETAYYTNGKSAEIAEGNVKIYSTI